MEWPTCIIYYYTTSYNIYNVLTFTLPHAEECPLPLPPAYGTILYHSDDPFQYNDIVVIECNDEYMLNGSDKYICNALPATFDLIGDVVPICEG